MKNDTTKVKVKHGGTTVVAELPWDANLEEMYAAFKGLLVIVGYSAKGIDNFIKELAND